MTEMKEILDIATRLELEGEELKKFIDEQQAIQRDSRQLRREEIQIFEERKRLEQDRLEVERRKLDEQEERRKSEERIENLKINHDREMEEEKRKLEQMKLKDEENKREHERKMEEQRQRLEQEKLDLEKLRDEDRRSGNLGKSKLPVFDEKKDSFDAYIARFENFATVRKWDESMWAIQLSLLLSGRALETYDSLSTEQQGRYQDIKEALLRSFELTEESFRRKLFSAKPEKGETPTQFSVQLSRYFDRWIECTGIRKDYDSVMNLLICEQFLKQCHSELEAHLRETKHQRFSELAKATELYIDAHGGTMNEPKYFKQKSVSASNKVVKEGAKNGENKHCKYCKKEGHDVSECEKLARKNEKQDVSYVRKCFVCGSKDHIAAKCPVKKDGTSTAFVSENEFIDLDRDGNISTGSVNGKQLIVLRDTGSDVMIVRAELVDPSQYKDRHYNLELADGTRRSYPMARVQIRCKYMQGDVDVAVMSTPVYDLIVGNNIPNNVQVPSLSKDSRREGVLVQQSPSTLSCDDRVSESSVDSRIENPVVDISSSVDGIDESVDSRIVNPTDIGILPCEGKGCEPVLSVPGIENPTNSVVCNGVVHTISAKNLVSPSRRKSLLKKARSVYLQKSSEFHQASDKVHDSKCSEGSSFDVHDVGHVVDQEVINVNTECIGGASSPLESVTVSTKSVCDAPSSNSDLILAVEDSKVGQDSNSSEFDSSCTDEKVAAVTTRAMSKRKSIQPLVVPDSEIVSSGQLRDEQKSDQSLLPFWKQAEDAVKVKKKTAQVSYEMRNDVLHRNFEKLDGSLDVRQVMVPLSLREKVMKLAHDSVASGHFGVRRTLSRVTSNFYWPGVARDVRRYCRSCNICQKTTDKGRVGRAPLVPLPQIRVPFSRVAVDLVGPLMPASEKGHRWILTLIDYATRYPEAVPLKSIDTISVAEALFGIFTRVGFPREILSDRGSQFISDVMKEVDRLLSINPLYATPYHPMCNGLVENFNGSLKRTLRRLSAEQPKQWDRYLPALLYAYRSIPQESTGYSPFELLYGRKIKGPMELLHDYWVQEELDDDVKNVYRYVIDLKSRLEDTCRLAHEELARSSQKQKLYFDKKTKPRSFAVGDEVLLLLPTKSNKLLLQWRGPYVVTKKVNQVDYIILVRGKEKTFHINMLKHYVHRDRGSVEGKVASVVCLNDGGDEVDDREIIDVCPLKATEDYHMVVMSDALSAEQKNELQLLLKNHSSVLTNLPGCTSVVTHTINVTSTNPVRGKTYALPYSVRDTVRKEVKDMLDLGVIRESSSPYSAPPVIVKKPDNSNRFCINYKAINAVSVFDSEPMPDPEEIFMKLNTMKFKSKLDLSKGYWQIQMAPESVEKTAFSTADGHFEFVRMPFGLMNSAATFNRLMRKVLGSIPGVGCFVDDVIIYSQTWSEHLNIIDEVFFKLGEAGLTVRPSKCMIGFHTIEFLGHEIGENTIAPRKQKVSQILEVERPTTKKQVKSYIALAGYYSKFIPNYSTITAPLSDLTKKGQPNKVKWLEIHEHSFQTIRRCLSSKPVMRILDPRLPMFVQTDAADRGIGCCLMQEFEGKLHPVRYLSRKLNDAERRYSTIEKECLAIVWAIEKLKVYLFGNEFVLLVDHAPLQFMKESNIKNSRIMRWSLFLQDWHFVVKPIKGVQNHVADFLSRA